MTPTYRKSPELEAKRYALAMEMHALHRDGLSIREIAARYETYWTSVVQRLDKWNLPIFRERDAINALKRAAVLRAAARKARFDARAQKKWGCTHDQYLMLQRMRKPTRAYAAQRRSANDRGIAWEFNLWQWWSIWQQSGHWEARGRTGYVMCRNGDVGPYHPDNVYIATSSQNIRDGYENRGGRRSKSGTTELRGAA